MKIIDIIRTLIESGEDFSDHATAARMPMHVDGRFASAEPCAFCEAWRAAQQLIKLPSGVLGEFEPGDPVLICNRAPGVVHAVRMQVDVRLGQDGDSPRPIGTFAPEFVSHAPAETFYRDNDGDIWKVVAPSTLSLCDKSFEVLAGKSETTYPESHVREEYGPLKKADKP